VQDYCIGFVVFIVWCFNFPSKNEWHFCRICYL